jgi:hypothetical protein
MLIVHLDGLGQAKNPITLQLEHATFQLVEWCFNQLHYHIPHVEM